MSFHFAHDTLILDASCIISLYASRQMEAILRSIPSTVTIAAYVYEREVFWVYSGGRQDGQRSKESINLKPLVTENLLKIVTIEGEGEAEVMANLSAKIRDQGESVTGAIAVNRNWAVAIDDRKARRVIQEIGGHIQLVYTLELVNHWAELNAIPADVVTDTLQNIRFRLTGGFLFT
jgi:predicted nucleic acid-binding protein